MSAAGGIGGAQIIVYRFNEPGFDVMFPGTTPWPGMRSHPRFTIVQFTIVSSVGYSVVELPLIAGLKLTSRNWTLSLWQGERAVEQFSDSTILPQCFEKFLKHLNRKRVFRYLNLST